MLNRLGLTWKTRTLGRDQVTRLYDLNGDDEADFYECVTHDYPTSRGNSYALTLHQDNKGTLYWFTRSDNFGVTRFGEGQIPESIATGLRGTNGTGVSEDGSIVLATAQEGTWTPASVIFEVNEGSYHGFQGPKENHGKYGYDLPLCFIPRGIDNSCGDIAFLPKDERNVGTLIATENADGMIPFDLGLQGCTPRKRRFVRLGVLGFWTLDWRDIS